MSVHDPFARAVLGGRSPLAAGPGDDDDDDDEVPIGDPPDDDEGDDWDDEDDDDDEEPLQALERGSKRPIASQHRHRARIGAQCGPREAGRWLVRPSSDR